MGEELGFAVARVVAEERPIIERRESLLIFRRIGEIRRARGPQIGGDRVGAAREDEEVFGAIAVEVNFAILRGPEAACPGVFEEDAVGILDGDGDARAESQRAITRLGLRSLDGKAQRQE